MEMIVEAASESGKGKRLLDQMRDLMRLKHYSFRTEAMYCARVERFDRKRHPCDPGEAEVNRIPDAPSASRERRALTQNA